MGILSSLFAFGQSKSKKVTLPKDEFIVVNTSLDGLPATIVVNTSLRKFKSKDIFGWSCSLVINFKELNENEMPTDEEYNFVINYLDELTKQVIGDPQHPNALLLARIIWKGTCEVIWQINNPEPVNNFLKDIIANNSYPRDFDYKIEYDAKWENVSFYTQKFK